MRPKSLGTWLILAVLLILLISAFASILKMRFSPGDIYPHYSSKRSDPLGSQVFYESLERLPTIDVSRNITSMQKIKGLDEETTLVLLGISQKSLRGLRATDDSPVLEAVRNGARLVMIMNPSFVPGNREENEDNWLERREKLKNKNLKKDKNNDESDESAEESESDEDIGIESPKSESFLKHVSIKLMVPKTFERPEGGWKVERVDSEDAELGEDLQSDRPEVFPNWHSQFRFNELGVLWSKIALVDSLPVVVERSYGKGSIVLASDAYFASNEALWKGEDTSFLWWLIGGSQRVVFDETIHGNVEHGGIMKLIRRYRLHGFFAGLFAFLVLFAWSSGSSLVPGSEEMERGLAGGSGAVTGEDVSSGMIRLLRRSVRPSELLERCVEIWGKTDSREGGMMSSLTPNQKKEVDRLLQIRRGKSKESSISDGYEKLVQVLNQKQ